MLKGIAKNMDENYYQMINSKKIKTKLKIKMMFP